jgi:AcrR family transcriptional regulator
VARHEDILERAAEVFNELGYRGASVEEVARRVGLRKGSLYHHVKSKEQLLAEVLLRGMELLRRGLPGADDARLSPGEKIRAAIAFHLDWMATEPHVTGVFLRELPSLPPRLRRRLMGEIEEFEARWRALVREGVAAGALRADLDPDVTVYAILGLVNSVHRWYRPDGRLSMKRIAEQCADLVLDGLRPRADGIPPRARHR